MQPPGTMPALSTARTVAALSATTVAVLAIPLTALGRVLDLWGPMPAMLYAFVATGLAALIATVLGLWGILRRRGAPWRTFQSTGSLAALVVGLAVLVPVAQTVHHALVYPPIHDISTDLEEPPQFVALETVRTAAGAPNSTAYDPASAPLQRAAYPDLGPRILPMATDAAFAKALAAAHAMGWKIAATDAAQGRIEASATTFWSGYVDDVAIRLRPVGDGTTRLDVRSLSRMGVSDLGKNAARIRAYLDKLD